MAQPHEDYHVRPFPRQPKRGGKELLEALKELEALLAEELPDLDRVREVQAKIHHSAADMTDDRLVDRLRAISQGVDRYLASPSKPTALSTNAEILKIFVDLKHL